MHSRAAHVLSGRRLFLLALSLVALFGLTLRLWRLDFGQMLPYAAHADEHRLYNPAVRIIKTGKWNPHFFNYPSLPIYVDTLAVYAAYQVGRISGVYDSPADLRPIRAVGKGRGRVGTPELLLVGRATTAVFGALTLAVIAMLTRPLVRERWIVLVPVSMLALHPDHLRFSHYMTVDVIATFFATACLAGCTLYLSGSLSGRGSRWLWAAAVCGGLSTASKYNFAVLAVPVALAAGLDPRLTRPLQVQRVAACGLLFCLAFVLTAPYVLLDFDAAMQAIAFELDHYATGHLGQSGESFPWTVRTLWNGNPVAVVLGVPGLVVALRRHKRVAVPAVAFAAVYFVMIGVQTAHMVRNALPLVVLLVVGTGVAVDSVLALLPARVPGWREKARMPALAIAVVCTALLPALPDLAALLHAPRPSGQAQAQAWFDRALSDATEGQSAQDAPRIAAEGYTIYLPRRHDVAYPDTVARIGPPAEFVRQKFDVVLLGSGMYDRFYRDREAYAAEASIYDAFFQLRDRIRFAGSDDPLSFVGRDATVYAFFLTDRARRFRARVEAARSSPIPAGVAEGR